MSGSNIEVGGDESDQGTIAQVIAVETAGTHAGVPSRTVSIGYNGQLVPLFNNVPIIADAGLYALINATDSTLVVWST